jgi:WD40 repeat protein
MHFVALESLLRRGVVLRPHEAVAIAQQLIHSTIDVELRAPFGPPTIESVVILPDGCVASSSSAATLAVSEVGRLLESMLPRGGRQAVPGGLRYAVARALLEVDAPPFDSLQALSSSLNRFEVGERRQVLRSLVARAEGTGPRLVARAEARQDAIPVRPVVTEVAAARSESTRHHDFAWRAAAAVILSFGLGWLAGSRISREQVAYLASTTVEVTTSTPPLPPTTTAGAAADMYSPAFSADGRTVFFHTGGTRSSRSALMKRGADDDQARPIPILDDGSRNYHAQPSPDGRHVAFDSDRDGERAVYVIDADGSNIRQISGSGYAAVPTWSPGSDRLAFIRAEPARPKVWNLWLLTFSTGELRRLTRFTYGQTWGASWLPDGRRVVFSHEDRLVMLSLDDGRMQSYPTPVRGRIVRTPAVSPDGGRVVFQVWHDGAWLLDLGTGVMRCVLEDPTAEEFAWSPDGRRVAYHSRAGGRWAIHVIARGQGRL